MTCIHCCYSCGSKGQDMSIKVFKKCLEWDNECISIGGGEPTIHPKFWEIIGLALGHVDYVWLAINGKEKDISLNLARMAKKGILACELSADEYHGKIDGAVFSAFELEKYNPHNLPNRNNGDLRGVRDITRWGEKNPIMAGRCDWGDKGCVCEDLFVKPNGNVYVCGCKNSPKLGNIMTLENLPDDLEWGECYKK